MSAIREWLKGKKTYLAGAITILTAVGGWATGDIEIPQLTQLIVAAVLTMTLRAGVAKAE